ncbi:MAG: hypothetical protein AB1391_00410 [Candidatus Micrarchaeota archaeon]
MNEEMKKRMENAFESTSQIIFRKRLCGLDNYSDWLSLHVSKPLERSSAISKQTVYCPNILFFKFLGNGIVTLAESIELGKKSILKEDAENLTLSNATLLLKEISYTTTEAVVGTNLDVEKSDIYGYSYHCYNGTYFVYSKYCAYCFWPRESEYCFGSVYTFNSKFCIKCYYSTNLTRCFEMLNCYNCSDCYFCYNSENLMECMFCFNTKSKRYAIGNIKVGKENYVKIKKIMMDEIVKRLEKDKKIDINIYNIEKY